MLTHCWEQVDKSNAAYIVNKQPITGDSMADVLDDCWEQVEIKLKCE